MKQASTKDIPSPGEYLLSQQERWRKAADHNRKAKCNMIADQSNCFVDALILSDEYHEHRVEN